jgi:hypothetical protein
VIAVADVAETEDRVAHGCLKMTLMREPWRGWM